MVKRYKTVICLILFLIVTHNNIKSSELQSKRSYVLLAAGVLPMIYDEDHSKITVLLGRQASGTEVGMWDYFGGFTKNQNDHNPLRDAAMEWNEESLLEKILGWSVDTTKAFIQQNLKGYAILATQEQISNTYGVMYIVNITPQMRDKILDNFDACRAEIMKTKQLEVVEDLLEVDKIIEVNWNDLLQWALPPRLRTYHKQLKDISSSRSIELRQTFRDSIEGIAMDNKYKYESQNRSINLPLGVFVIGRKSDHKPWQREHFQLCDLAASEKESLNKIVIDNLGLNKIQQAAVLQKMKKEKKGEDKSKKAVTQQLTVQKNIAQHKNPDKSSLNLASSAIFVAILAHKNKPTSPVASISSSLPKVTEKIQKKEKPKEKEPSLFTSIGKMFESGLEIIANVFNDVWNFMSAFFKGRDS